MTIQFQRLLDVCKATEKVPSGGFNMASVCGTACCMVGNYNAMVGREPGTFGTLGIDWEHFGISLHEYFWLFGAGGGRRTTLATDWAILHNDIEDVERQEALRRLRKFIYYKLHKHEMIHDEKYGVRQEARTKEGNHNFAQRAKSEACAVA